MISVSKQLGIKNRDGGSQAFRIGMGGQSVRSWEPPFAKACLRSLSQMCVPRGISDQPNDKALPFLEDFQSLGKGECPEDGGLPVARNIGLRVQWCGTGCNPRPGPPCTVRVATKGKVELFVLM